MKLIGLRVILAFERWYLNRLRFWCNPTVQEAIKLQSLRVKALEKRVNENRNPARKSK